MPTNSLLRACRYLLEPIARLCIRNGVPWAEFAEVTKQAFVKVARRDYGLQGRPTNMARVAMLTGLSRREVTRVRDLLSGKSGPESPVRNRLSQILTGWHIDPEFLTKEGAPAELPEKGETGSLEALLRRYAGDMPHGAVVKEMERLGLLEPSPNGFKVTARDYIRSPSDPEMLRQASIALHDHAQTVVHNVDENRPGPPFFERMATQTHVPQDVASEFRDFINVRGQAFLEEVDAWLQRHTADASASASQKVRIRTGLGIYLINDPEQEIDEDE